MCFIMFSIFKEKKTIYETKLYDIDKIIVHKILLNCKKRKKKNNLCIKSVLLHTVPALKFLTLKPLHKFIFAFNLYKLQNIHIHVFEQSTLPTKPFQRPFGTKNKIGISKCNINHIRYPRNHAKRIVWGDIYDHKNTRKIHLFSKTSLLQHKTTRKHH